MPFFVRAKSSKLQIITKKTVACNDVEVPLDLENHFYIRNWAVSSYERWGLNTNADGFRHRHLSNDFKSFDGAWVCLDHVAESSEDSVGSVLHPVYTNEQYVENILAVNRTLVEKKGYPFLEKDILEGRITDTSMGAVSRATECTICRNVARNEKEYCEHLRKDALGNSMKGRTVVVAGKPRVVGELYVDSIFLEDSILTEDAGADINAKIFNIAASRNKGVACGDALYFAIKAAIKEHGRTRYLSRLLDSFEQKIDV